MELTDDDVIRALGGLPESKRHCSLLGVRALRAALWDALTGRRLIEQEKVQDFAEYRRLRDEGQIRLDFTRPPEGKLQ